MAKNLISHPILVQIWVPIIFFVDFTSTRCETMLQAITVCNFKKNVRSKLKKMAKNLILDLIKAHWAQIWAGNFFVFFFKNLAKIRHYISWSAIIMYNIRKNSSEGWTRVISYDTIRQTSSIQKR